MDVAESTEKERRFESELIHASPRVLLIGAIGLAVYGVGRVIGVSLGHALTGVGTVVFLIALVLHFDHLSFRIGRVAVVLVMVGAISDGAANVIRIFAPAPGLRTSLAGLTYVLFGAAAAAIAVHKERQMKAMLDEYAAGTPWRAQVTVHATFLALTTGAIGLVLYGVGLMWSISDSGTGWAAVMVVGAVVLAIGLISHIEHLVPRLGVIAVGAVILAAIVNAAGPLRNALSATPLPNDDTWWQMCMGIAALLGSLACLIALQKKRSADNA
ncbi:MAG: hypothetical protein WCI29_11275 [Actinomycetes bacterium]